MQAELRQAEQLAERIVELEKELEALRMPGEPPGAPPDAGDARCRSTHKFDIAGHEGYLTVGLYEDGQPGEIFIQMSKEGSTIGGLMDTVATLTSMALQYGVPLESLLKKFAYQRFEPSGFTKNPDIRNATSITDYVFRWLGCQFIKGYKEATSPHATPARPPDERASAKWKEARLNRPSPTSRAPARRRSSTSSPTAHLRGRAVRRAACPSATPTACRKRSGSMYMDITCSNCGSNKVIRAGACGCCTECGTSQGCS